MTSDALSPGFATAWLAGPGDCFSFTRPGFATAWLAGPGDCFSFTRPGFATAWLAGPGDCFSFTRPGFATAWLAGPGDCFSFTRPGFATAWLAGPGDCFSFTRPGFATAWLAGLIDGVRGSFAAGTPSIIWQSFNHSAAPVSNVNQKSTPVRVFFTPQRWWWASAMACTMERPRPEPPYALVWALSTL